MGLEIITTFYLPSSRTRLKELWKCLLLNLQRSRTVHLFLDDQTAASWLHTHLPSHLRERARIARVGPGPPSYTDLLSHASALPAGTPCMVANADVYVRKHGPLPTADPPQVFCLSRHEADGSAPMCTTPGILSHDAFLFRSPLPPNYDFASLPRRQNIPGAENIVANAFYRAGYRLRNPCWDWVIVHEHKDARRSYDTRPQAHLLQAEKAKRGGRLLHPPQWGARPDPYPGPQPPSTLSRKHPKYTKLPLRVGL